MTLHVKLSDLARLGLSKPKKARSREKRTKATPRQPSTFMALCVAHGVREPIEEYLFHPTRQWRFDWCWPEHMIALEQDGAVWTRGRHTRGAGFIADQEKGNAAVVLGWRVLHCTPQDVKSGAIFSTLKEVLL